MGFIKKYKKVFFIENNKVLCDFYHSGLETKNLSEYFKHYDNFTDVIIFLKTAKKKDFPAYIIFDLNLPDMNGFEFLKQISKINKAKNSVEFYVCSASENGDDRKKAMIFPFVSAYFQKPLTEKYIEFLITGD